MIAGTILLHGTVSVRRSSRLLEHDEAISLLAAAGKAPRVDAFYEAINHGRIRTFPARDMQDLLRPTGETGAQDVVRSLAERDIHPPLYFLLLHAAQRLGVTADAALRMPGVLWLLVAAWAAGRWIWPDAPFAPKLLGAALMIASPVMVGIATELRQYALVYLGTALSFAALLAYWNARRPAREAIVLMSLAPVLLLWSQFGTAIWVGVAFAIAMARRVRGPAACRKVFAPSVLIAVVLLLPLALERWHGLSAAVASTGRAPSLASLGEATRAVMLDAARAWCSLPARWPHLAAWPVVAVVCGVVGVTVLARRAVVDRVLSCGALVWTLVWILWLVGGKIPPHAAHAKHLAPLVLCPLVLLVRATSAENSTRVRRLAFLALAGSVATHLVVGTWQTLTRLHPQPSVAALRSADCLMIDMPKRGYVLPLVAKMDPDAPVVMATAAVAADHWAELEKLLPDGTFVLAEIDSYRGDRRGADSQEVFDRLARMYREVRTLRKEPRRTITEFRYRRRGDRAADSPARQATERQAPVAD